MNDHVDDVRAFGSPWNFSDLVIVELGPQCLVQFEFSTFAKIFVAPTCQVSGEVIDLLCEPLVFTEVRCSLLTQGIGCSLLHNLPQILELLGHCCCVLALGG